MLADGLREECNCYYIKPELLELGMTRKKTTNLWKKCIKSHDAFFRLVLGAIILRQCVRNLVFVVLELKPDYLLINLSRYTENETIGTYGTVSDWEIEGAYIGTDTEGLWVVCQIIETEVGYHMVLLLTLGERW